VDSFVEFYRYTPVFTVSFEKVRILDHAYIRLAHTIREISAGRASSESEKEKRQIKNAIELLDRIIHSLKARWKPACVLR
jgi:hypothetical protein